MKRRYSNHRVFFGFNDTAGYFSSLAEGVRELGGDTQLVALVDHKFGYPVPPLGRTGKLIQRLARLATGKEESARWQRLPGWQRRTIGWGATLLAALRYNVFVFASGLTFDDVFGPGCNRILKLFRRKISIFFSGSDSRPIYCSRVGLNQGERTRRPAGLLRHIELRKEMVVRAHAVADLVVDNVTSCHFHPGPFYASLNIGLPKAGEAGAVSGRSSDQHVHFTGAMGAEAARILHCPSKRNAKGSEQIKETIARLADSGTPIEFVELSGVPNRTVLEAIAECDFVIDQIYSDFPMATFAREAATFGKAAVVGGFAWQELRKHIDEPHWPPGVYCLPDELETCLAEFLGKGREHWNEVGERARAFATERWSTKACAEQFLSALGERGGQRTGHIDPRDCEYVWGFGVNPLEVIELAQLIMRTRGPEGFGIEGKPELLERYVALGTLDLEQDSPPAIEELSTMEKENWPTIRALIQRNVDIQAQRAEEALELEKKLENFRAMIARRDERIAKLERSLGKKKKRK